MTAVRVDSAVPLVLLPPAALHGRAEVAVAQRRGWPA